MHHLGREDLIAVPHCSEGNAGWDMEVCATLQGYASSNKPTNKTMMLIMLQATLMFTTNFSRYSCHMCSALICEGKWCANGRLVKSDVSWQCHSSCIAQFVLEDAQPEWTAGISSCYYCQGHSWKTKEEGYGESICLWPHAKPLTLGGLRFHCTCCHFNLYWSKWNSFTIIWTSLVDRLISLRLNWFSVILWSSSVPVF